VWANATTKKITEDRKDSDGVHDDEVNYMGLYWNAQSGRELTRVEKIKVLLNHLEKRAEVGSQIDVVLLSALSIDYAGGDNEITNWMCPLVNN